MFSISVANLLSYFYPLGNTPAVSLTQGLPCGALAKVLLLGCGDLRHVLFTLHVDPRPLDITACDIQPAVIARNIFLLALLISDDEGSYDKSNWDLYFHFKIDDASLERLRGQAEKLCSLSATLQDWMSSEYGRFVTFCDQETLHSAREIWSLWANWNSQDNSQFDHALRKAKEIKSMKSHGTVLTALRSASPVFVDAFSHLPELHTHYWEHGTTDTNLDAISLARNLNPLFAIPSTDQVLHYGMDPLLDFHLAIAYAPLATDNVLFKNPAGQQELQTVVNAAQSEFAAWTASFRKNSRQGFIIRFFAGDAIAFSFQLRNARAGLGRSSAGWYRDRTHFTPVVLSDDYNPDGSAPTLFDVIDTSNLTDHLGALNLLTAVAPLLSNDISATLYTERLLNLSATRQDLLDDLLGGHLPTMSALLGLISVEVVTSASCTSPGDERLMDMSLGQLSERKSGIGQRFVRLAWKRPISMPQPPLSQGALKEVCFEAADLGRVLYSVYLNMFQGEDLASIMTGLRTPHLTADQVAMSLHKRSLPNYHRASFAAFLRFVKSRVNVDWKESLHTLLTLIESNLSYPMSRNYVQELYVWLHLLDVHTVGTLASSPSRHLNRGTRRDLRSWDNVPTIVCLTLEVPRGQLSVFKDGDTTLGTPPIHCSVGSPPNHPAPYENHFAALQIGFGTVSTSGLCFSDSFKVDIAEDGSAWSGQLPLLISFYVPTWILFLELQHTVLTFGLEVTPQTVKAFSRRLGLGLTVFRTTLDDSQHVYITEHPPNMATKPTLSSFGVDDQPQQGTSTDAKQKLSAVVAPKANRITSLISRVDLQGKLGAALSRGRDVNLKALSPLNYEIRLGQGPPIVLDFPVPVAQSNIKTRIARTSSYIELVATVEPVILPMGSFIHPIIQTSSAPVLWNLPYLNLNLQPALDITQPRLLEWLTPHTAMMLSARQRHLREDRLLPAPAEERTAVELKDSLFSLFMHYSGLQGEKTTVFGISCPTAGGVHILLLVSHLRLDLSCRTVVLDAAAIPLHYEIMPQISPLLQALTNGGNLCQVSATESEMTLWKLMLPAWVERCRSWSHTAGCEYAAMGRIPLSAEEGQKCLCSCGNGKFPADYLQGVPKGNEILRYAVRVAISPLFHSALVDDPFAGEESPKACKKCGKGEQDTSLMRCARCRRVKYCSKDCQRADWKRHKRNCEKKT